MTELVELQLEKSSISTLRDKVLQELKQREVYRPDLVRWWGKNPAA